VLLGELATAIHVFDDREVVTKQVSAGGLVSEVPAAAGSVTATPPVEPIVAVIASRVPGPGAPAGPTAPVGPAGPIGPSAPLQAMVSDADASATSSLSFLISSPSSEGTEQIAGITELRSFASALCCRPPSAAITAFYGPRTICEVTPSYRQGNARFFSPGIPFHPGTGCDRFE
jgi:hypothetical protein